MNQGNGKSRGRSRIGRSKRALAFVFGFGWLLVLSPAGGRLFAAESAAGAGSASAASRIRAAIRLIAETAGGAEILSSARTLWGADPSAWIDAGRIREGEVSRTDATLTRSWDAKSGTEIREREVAVHLKLSQPLQEVSLDLAHELTHAVAQPAWDPYDPELRAETYVRNAIEGRGGEVDAILRECNAAFELEKKGGISISRCDRYRKAYNETGAIPRAEVARDFYASGKSFDEIPAPLKRSLPAISARASVYFSSTGHAPYPLALLREFEALNEVACSNTRSRLLRQAGALRNSQGEAAAEETVPAVEKAKRFLEKRCR